MKTSSSLALFSIFSGTLALASCRPDPLGTTGVQLDLITKDPHLYATSFQVVWMDETTQLREIRVPDQGALDETQAPAVSVYIALTPDKAGMRRVLVRGFRDDRIISEGAARLFATPNYWNQLGLPMLANGTLPDSDGDGLPDSVDNCPHERDPCGAAGVDAGTDVDASDVDAGAPDADEMPDAQPIIDGPAVLPTGFDAGASDARPI